MKDKSISEQLAAVAEDICDHYCKWPEKYDAMQVNKYGQEFEIMWDEVCCNCPLTQFM